MTMNQTSSNRPEYQMENMTCQLSTNYHFVFGRRKESGQLSGMKVGCLNSGLLKVKGPTLRTVRLEAHEQSEKLRYNF